MHARSRAHSHTRKHTLTQTQAHLDTHRNLGAEGLKTVFEKRKIFKEDLKDPTEDA